MNGDKYISLPITDNMMSMDILPDIKKIVMETEKNIIAPKKSDKNTKPVFIKINPPFRSTDFFKDDRNIPYGYSGNNPQFVFY